MERGRRIPLARRFVRRAAVALFLNRFADLPPQGFGQDLVLTGKYSFNAHSKHSRSEDSTLPIGRPGRKGRAVHHREGGQAAGQGHALGRAYGFPCEAAWFHGRADRRTQGLRSHGQRRDRAALRTRRRVKLLLDKHLLLSAAGNPDLLSKSARALIDTPDNSLIFSAASMWEVVIKRNLGRHDFRLEPRLLRRGLLDNGYLELPITSEHAV